MADGIDTRRFRVEVHPKTGEHAVKDTTTGELLDIRDCASLLNGTSTLDTEIATE
jgi:hypothetical protein